MNKRLSDLTVGDLLTVAVVIFIIVMAALYLPPAIRHDHRVASYARCVADGRPDCRQP